MKYVVWSLVVLLVILHQDYWNWDNGTLDFGFLPRALTYHVGISIAAAAAWLLAIHFCWPEGTDAERSSAPEDSAP